MHTETNLKFLVSCNHVDARWQRTDLPVEVRPSRQGEGRPDKYYVSITGFGCSKDYASPHGAIRGMLQDHACTDIQIVPAQPDGTRDIERIAARARIERIWQRATKQIGVAANLVATPAEWDFLEALLLADKPAAPAAPAKPAGSMTVNHLEDGDIARLREINQRLFGTTSPDERRDLANTMLVILAKVETAEVFTAPGVKAIQDALGTAEEGDGLVEVASNAAKAERQVAGDTYNGWSNYETWLTYTWLSNVESTYHTCRSLAKSKESDYVAGDLLKEAVPELLNFPVTGLAADCVTACITRVDWKAIAEHFRSE